MRPNLQRGNIKIPLIRKSWARFRRPNDMIFQGCSTILFQASQQ